VCVRVECIGGCVISCVLGVCGLGFVLLVEKRRRDHLLPLVCHQAVSSLCVGAGAAVWLYK
jgi:hypothetical protein